MDWLSALLVARDRGGNLTNIAQIFQESGQRLIAWNSSGIRTIPQLRGKRVGVTFAGNQYQFYALMSHFHLSPPQKYMRVVAKDVNMNLSSPTSLTPPRPRPTTSWESSASMASNPVS